MTGNHSFQDSTCAHALSTTEHCVGVACARSAHHKEAFVQLLPVRAAFLHQQVAEPRAVLRRRLHAPGISAKVALKR